MNSALKSSIFFLLSMGLIQAVWARANDVGVATAASEISAAVQTVPLRQQMISAQISAYGMVGVDVRHTQILNLPRAGQVQAVYVSVGQRVVKGMPLLAFATSPDAALSYQQASLALHYAQAERARVTQLLAQQLATQSQWAVADKAVADAQDNLSAQQKAGSGQPVVQLAAPYDAVVSTVLVMPGDRLGAGAGLLQLAPAGSQRAILGVEPGDAVWLRPGMPVQVAAVFALGHQYHMGRVAQVMAMINPQTQLVDVLVDLPGAGMLLGTHVSAIFQTDQQMDYVVPRSAVLRDQIGAYLFQVQQGRARRIAVQTGTEQDGLIAVRGALLADAPVVSLGNYELQDGMAVRGGGQ